MERLSLDQKIGIIGLVLAILGITLGLGVALGMETKTNGEMYFAIACFVFSAVALSATIGAWAYISEALLWKRLLLSGISGALIMVCLVLGIEWATGRHPHANTILEQPTFREHVTQAEFTIGRNGMNIFYTLEQLRKGPASPFKISLSGEPYYPVAIYVEGDRLFMDVKVSGP
jgi:hypothetical protein